MERLRYVLFYERGGRREAEERSVKLPEAGIIMTGLFLASLVIQIHIFARLRLNTPLLISSAVNLSSQKAAASSGRGLNSLTTRSIVLPAASMILPKVSSSLDSLGAFRYRSLPFLFILHISPSRSRRLRRPSLSVHPKPLRLIRLKLTGWIVHM